VAFAIAAVVYLATMERTVSFWDCGEFLACAYKLQVGHSPGAPFFMLMQRLFGMFAENGLTGGPSTNAALLINSMSALMSAGTILFLFWTITHFARRIVMTDAGDNRTVSDAIQPTGLQTALILGSGLVGALTYTFSDTFWFSAVEGEVYATSSFFTALTFWAILKWERVADEPHADRWLVFIAYLIGLSVAIHLLNLLCIPAIGLVYYFRRYPTATTRGTVTAFAVSCVILGLIQFGILQGLPTIASGFELLFVNNLGLPFDSGSLTFLVLLVAALAGGLVWARRARKYTAHLAILSTIFIILGFSSYMMAIVRSRADVPIDMTNPDNTFSLTSYLKREQFGQQPLLYGPDYDAGIKEVKASGDEYIAVQKDGKDHYEDVGDKPKYVFEEDKQRFFPRIWDSNDPSHVRFYQEYLGLAEGERPSAGDNWKFFVGYQMNWMWWRYFLWNYAGRQNDFEGQGDPRSGNWISGIPFVDKAMGHGNLDKMPDGYRNNRARNQYYFLPLVLGVMGLVHQFNRRKRDGWVVFTLFFFTGIAIGIYLNMTPLQPRERDYAFAGSTYAFAVWIGLGVLMLHQWISRAVKGTAGAYAAIALATLAVPVLMASQNWDDHDRSNRSLALATAKNTLGSLEKNAILFCFGDNETYPLWYIQEIEGYRRDVRVINTSLLGIGWYIDQLNYKINDAAPVPMAWKREAYVGDRRNYAVFDRNSGVPQDRFYPLAEIIQFISSDNPADMMPNPGGGRGVNYYPTKNFFIPTPGAAALLPSATDTSFRPDTTATAGGGMRISIAKDVLPKDDLAQLAIIAAVAQDGWKRPIYYSNTQELGGFGNLKEYLRVEGTVYRVVPFKSATPQASQLAADGGFVDLTKSYNLFMNQYSYGGAEKNDAYFDEKNRIMLAPYRIGASRLADELAAVGRQADAVRVLDKVMAGISERSYSYDGTAFYMALSYMRAGAKDKAAALARKISRNCEDDINWVLSLSEDDQVGQASELQRDLSILNGLGMASTQTGDATLGKELTDKVNSLFARLPPELQRAISGQP